MNVVENVVDVLLVDDDEDVREALAANLRADSLSVLTATHGLDALRLLEAGASPAVILLDLVMPVMDGWHFRAAQREKAVLIDVPTFILSGERNLREIADSLRVTGSFSKPIDYDALLHALQPIVAAKADGADGASIPPSRRSNRLSA